MSTPPAIHKDFELGKEFATRPEFDAHMAKVKRLHTLHAPCGMCGEQLHLEKAMRVNKKTGVPTVFCDACRADLLAEGTV